MKDFVTVANFRRRLDAEIASGLLTAEGIPYLIQSMEGAGYGPGPHGADLVVRPEHVERARAILLEAGAIQDEGK